MEQGGNIRFHIETEDVIHNVYLGKPAENGNGVSNILSANSEGDPTFYMMAYKDRTTITRSDTRKAVTIIIIDVRSADAGTYHILVEGYHEKHEQCKTVYVLGKYLQLANHAPFISVQHALYAVLSFQNKDVPWKFS